jgi:hypothetical protein
MASFSKIFSLATAACCSTTLLTAQFDSGQISGFVRDPSGAVVPGASVVATNAGTKEPHRTVSNSEGYYVFPQLVVGTYALAIEARGFKRYVKSGIALNAEAKVSSDVDLTVGTANESVEVTASSATVQVDTAQVATSIETKQMQDLTLNGRNPIYLAALSPGVVGGTIGTFDPDSVSNGSFNINGGPMNMSWSSTAPWPRVRAHRGRWWAPLMSTRCRKPRYLREIIPPSTAGPRAARSGLSPRAAPVISMGTWSKTSAIPRSMRTRGHAITARRR